MADILWGLLQAVFLLGIAYLVGLIIFVVVAVINAPGDSFDE